jgi:ribonucleoside-diphosphate reductase alpha chain
VEPSIDRIREESDAARAAVLRSAICAPGERDLAAVAERVGGAIAAAEAPERREELAERFADSLRALRFVPSVPILSNAGRLGQLAACFVLEPEDSLASIYDVLARAARIQQRSGGVGVHFSRLRPRGAPIRRAGGVSPGPSAFVELFAHSARVNSLSGRRPGAHLAVLRDDHPDLLEFVHATARSSGALAGMGLALSVGDALLAAARENAAHELRWGGAVQRVPAREMLDEIARAIVATGQPTLLFRDAIAAGNPVPHLGALEATNPCGEQPLLPGESCVLGSLHLPAFADARGALDLEALRAEAALAVRFLDDVVEVQQSPDAACDAASRATRKIGLGVMGLADVLLLRGVPYDDDEAGRIASECVRAIADAARAASEALAAERGPYPAWRGPGTPRRNATTLAIAPTGTLRLLAGCNGGIEPLLQPVTRVRAPEGEWRCVPESVLRWLERARIAPGALLDALEADAPLAQLPGLAAEARALWRRGAEISPERQLAMQACVQRHVDGAVSKTVQLAPDATAERVAAWISLARALGCKGAAFYRAPRPAQLACVECGEPGSAFLG